MRPLPNPDRQQARHLRRKAAAAALAAGWAVSLTAAAQGGSAFPDGAQTLLQSAITINTGQPASSTTREVVQVQPGAALQTVFNNPWGRGAAEVDLSTGVLRAEAFSGTGLGNSVAAWEFLRFSGSAGISFAFTVDGWLSNAKNGGVIFADAAMALYDVTDWTDWFRSIGDVRVLAKDGVLPPGEDRVAGAFERHGVRGNAAPSCESLGIDVCTTSISGIPVAVEFELFGSAIVHPDRLYVLELVLNLGTLNVGTSSGFQNADFMHTATFAFSDLVGLTVTSASGQFLSPVPEPATWALWCAGLAVAGRVAARTGRRSAAAAR